jgi:uncharacterized protein (DUF58 family)
MCYAGASQNNGAAYLLCFLLTGLAIVSMVHAWSNLQGIVVTVESIPAVFAGEVLCLPVVVTTTNTRTLFGVRIFPARGALPLVDQVIRPHAPSRIEVPLPAEKRGLYRQVELEIASDYPLGFFTARQLITVAIDHTVYPALAGHLPWPEPVTTTHLPRDGARRDGDDFGGTRMWRAGESQRHIDWKAAARNPVLLTKQWTGEFDGTLHFDWSSLPNLEVEARLSQLARWIVTAEHGLETYDLHLPGKALPAGRGDKHYHDCLHALAAFDETGKGADR